LTIRLSVVLPTYNPSSERLLSVLEALRAQSLGSESWELLVVDNGSDPPLEGRIDLTWHSSGRIVREDALGLTRARLSGFHASKGEIVVLVDDDNVLAPDFLEQALRIADVHPELGTWSGSVFPRYERPDLAPPKSLLPLLTIRQLTSDLWSNDVDHHASTPWGAGMCIRQSVLRQYVIDLEARLPGLQLDLEGERLIYGGDTDIAYTGCAMGLGKGVFRALRLEHLIPAQRCGSDYLCRVSEGRGFTEVLHTLILTGRLPEEGFSIGRWLREKRSVLRGSLVERRVARARLKGRSRAMRELRSIHG